MAITYMARKDIMERKQKTVIIRIIGACLCARPVNHHAIANLNLTVVSHHLSVMSPSYPALLNLYTNWYESLLKLLICINIYTRIRLIGTYISRKIYFMFFSLLFFLIFDIERTDKNSHE